MLVEIELEMGTIAINTMNINLTIINFAEPRTCRDIGLKQCCDEDAVEEGGCIVYYGSGVTTNNDGCSCALSCHQNSEHGCCPDAVQIGCVRKSK